MSDDLLSKLTVAAVSSFRAFGQQSIEHNITHAFMTPDSVLMHGQQIVSLFNTILQDMGEVGAFAQSLFSNSDFSDIAPREGELDAMVIHPGGGFRINANGLIYSLFSSAMLQMYFFRLPMEETGFVRLAIENFDELRRALRGQEVRCYVLSGFSGVNIPETVSINTPWGTVSSAPNPDRAPMFFPPFGQTTTCILADQRLIPVFFDRAAQPEKREFDAGATAVGSAEYLMPLAFALSSEPSENNSVPILRWSTTLLPFQFGLGFHFRVNQSKFSRPSDFEGKLKVEEWSRIVNTNHSLSVDTAARRLVSAIGHRLDQSDALIDAVMVWENLLGTSSEVTFRISAALAKLIEKSPDRRKELKKELSKIYGIRSRVVHGAAVEVADIQSAASSAINFAIMALRESYSRGFDWLAMNSNERSDEILLEWP